jgi:hypothetical protein
MNVSAKVNAIRKGVPLVGEVGAFFFRNHGVVIHVFGPLLRDFGVLAGKDIAILTRAFNRAAQSGSEAAFRAAEAAAGRLRKLVVKLPQADQQSVAIELERRMQTLNQKRDEFGKLFAEEVQDAKRAKKAAKTLASAESALRKSLDADKLIAKLGEVRAARGAADPAVDAVWKAFESVVDPLVSAGVRDAATYAAQHSDKIKKLLKDGKLTQELWGYLVKIRGALGEDYALGNAVWHKKRDELLGEAAKHALQMGDGYEVRYLTQLDHGIKLNGGEGPDALIAIIHPDKKEIYFYATVQAKTADTSEALTQIVDGIARSGGKKGAAAVPVATVNLNLDGDLMVLTASRNSSFTESFYLINASESTIPTNDLLLLQQSGIRATELQLDMTVDQFTHLALDVMEAAAKAF